MKTATLSLAALSLFILSCGSGPSEQELALKQKELELKERELALQEKEKPTVKDTLLQFAATNTTSEPMEDQSALIEKLLGCWAVEENTYVNLQFYRNGEFTMNDYNKSIHEWEVLYGTFQIKGESLTLLHNDRPKQTFRFYKSKDFANTYYVQHPKNTRYLFVRSNCESLQAPTPAHVTSDTTAG